MISQPCMKCRRQLRRHLRELNAVGGELVLYHGSTQSAINLQECSMFLHLTPKRAQRFVETYVDKPEKIYVHAYKVHGRLLEFREYRRLGIPVPKDEAMNNWARMEEDAMIYKIMKHNVNNDRNDLAINSFAVKFCASGHFDVAQQRYMRSINNEYIGHWQLEEGVRTVCVYDADRSLELVKRWRVK